VWQFFGRTDGIGDAPPTNEVSFSDDGSHWKVATSGRFTDDQTEKEVDWSPAAARYVRLRALSEAGGGQLTSAAELTPLQAPAPDIRSR
jgi:phospholipase C